MSQPTTRLLRRPTLADPFGGPVVAVAAAVLAIVASVVAASVGGRSAHLVVGAVALVVGAMPFLPAPGPPALRQGRQLLGLLGFGWAAAQVAAAIPGPAGIVASWAAAMGGIAILAVTVRHRDSTIRPDVSQLALARAASDLVLLALSLGTLWWRVRLGTVVSDADLDPVAAFRPTVYAVLGLALLGLMVVLPMVPGRVALRFRCATLVLCGGLLGEADERFGGTGSGWWPVVTVLSFVIFATGFRQPMEALPAVQERQEAAESFVPALLSALAWLVVVGTSAQHEIDGIVVASATVCASLVLLRSLLVSLEKRRLVARLDALATTDPLTGLPNRRGFDRAVAEVEAGALVLIDLDGFKRVNDRLGHTVGDQLLRAVADVTVERIPTGATFARLGGDEFALVVPAAVGADAEQVAAAIVDAIASIRFAGHLSASAGLARIEGVGEDGGSAIRDAGIALRAAKAGQPGRVLVLDPVMRRASLRETALAQHLSAAIEAGHISLRFQPVVRLSDAAIIGVEALAQWDSDELGRVEADEFIRIAERIGRIDRLGDAVVGQVIEQARAWRAAGVHLPIAVNVSTIQLRDPAFASLIADRVEAAGVGGAISLEVTESALIDEVSLEALEELHRRGFSLTIDDFGTGYSSLDYLCRIPAETIKLDRRFIAAFRRDPKAAAVVEAVVELAHRLGLQVVAEGVEDAETAAVLADLGYDLGQGYLFGRPTSPAGVAELVARTAADQRAATATRTSRS